MTEKKSLEELERDGTKVGIHFMRVKPDAPGAPDVAQQVSVDPPIPEDAEVDDLDALQAFAVELETLSEWDPLWLPKCVRLCMVMVGADVKFPDDEGIFTNVARGYADGIRTLNTLIEVAEDEKRKDAQRREGEPPVDWSKN